MYNASGANACRVLPWALQLAVPFVRFFCQSLKQTSSMMYNPRHTCTVTTLCSSCFQTTGNVTSDGAVCGSKSSLHPAVGIVQPILITGIS